MTVVVSALAMVVLSLGAVVFDAIDSMSVFVSLLLVVVSPWADFGLCRISPERGTRG